MSLTTTIDLGPVAHGLGLSLDSVENVVRLLDDDNTVPFITRYRKDQTGGLDEEQIRQIEARVSKLRLLAERKQTILRSIDSQGKLTPELAAAINAADSTKRLEDLYLPYKPKKQSLATLARERQLEPLAQEILTAAESAADLDIRARDFINPDKQVGAIADVLLGVGHILAEDYSERADLRDKLRRIFKKSGKLVGTKIESDKKPEEPKSEPAAPHVNALAPTVEGSVDQSAMEAEAAPVVVPETHLLSETYVESDPTAESGTCEAIDPSLGQQEQQSIDAGVAAVDAANDVIAQLAATVNLAPEAHLSEPVDAALPHSSNIPAEITTPTNAIAAETAAPIDATTPAQPHAHPAAIAKPAEAKPAVKKSYPKKPEKKLENSLEHEFRDYFAYQESLSRIPPHRVLALNRGERAKILRVRVDADFEAMHKTADELLVPREHPHADFLRACVRDALTRLVIPSLEREVRRELTDFAETHAVDVFAKNLRNLLLQAPVRARRVLALDPGFKSGCKIAVLDEFGNLLDHGLIHIIGRAERQAEGRAKIVEWIKLHGVNVLAIGNGTACRETEEFVAGILAEELKDEPLAYMIVNEAGASVYSTSQLGREEFPNYDATLRGAISIGRRMLDPLSELVKIDPANLGVGLYQHDVKAKHLRASLDAVVESCVNFVGVDLNTASPALLRYVSGLNQLKARQIFDYRSANGPFKNRSQLQEVPGFGEASFVQAAGFLKIVDGEHALDATWIHPESYAAARAVLERLNCAESDLAKKETAGTLSEQIKPLDLKTLAAELQVGQLSLADILTQLTRPGRDPREDLPPPIFKRGILKLDDLSAGMELTGSVLNVVDFGAFVDIGLHDSGLVHVSQLANRFVRDPHEVVSVGDIVKVWVLEIDKSRRRVSLTMIAPGTKRFDPRAPRQREGQQQGGQREGQQPGGQQSGQQQGAQGQREGDRPPRGERPPRGDRPPRQQGTRPGGQRPPAQQTQAGAPANAATPGSGAAPSEQRPQSRPPVPSRSSHEVQKARGMIGPPMEQFQKKFGGGTKKFGQRSGGNFGGGKPGGGQGGGQGGGGFGGGGRRFDKSGGRGEPKSFEAKSNKPLVPISDKMKQGKEPLRTFSDLLQFVKQKDEPETVEPTVTAQVESNAAVDAVATTILVTTSGTAKSTEPELVQPVARSSSDDAASTPDPATPPT